MGRYFKKNQIQALHFLPMGLFQAASMTSKMTAPEIHLFIFNFENVEKTLGDICGKDFLLVNFCCNM